MLLQLNCSKSVVRLFLVSQWRRTTIVWKTCLYGSGSGLKDFPWLEVGRIPLWSHFVASLSPRPLPPCVAEPRRDDYRARGVAREAARLQRQYRIAPKRAMRDILEDSSSFCAIPGDRIAAFFKSFMRPSKDVLVSPRPAASIPLRLLLHPSWALWHLERFLVSFAELSTMLRARTA